MNDTPPEITEIVRARFMAMSGAERIRIGVEMSQAARRMVLASLPADLSETDRKRRLYERVYGEPVPTRVACHLKNARFTGHLVTVTMCVT
jgi:hypothetical protein